MSAIDVDVYYPESNLLEFTSVDTALFALSAFDARPSVTFAIALSPTTVAVVFSDVMEEDEIGDAANYAIVAAGGSTARTVSGVVVESEHLVTLTLSGIMTPGTSNYTVTVSGVHDINAREINAAEDDWTFDGPESRPHLRLAVATSPTTVRVVFDEPMNNSDLGTAGYYTLTPAGGSAARSVSSVSVVSSTIVDLTLNGLLTPGTGNYTLTVSTSMRDLSGVPIDSSYRTFVISGPDTRPLLLYAVATSSTQVVAVFDRAMNLTDLADESLFTLTPDVGSAARSVTSAIAQGTHLTILTLDGDLTPGTDNYLLAIGAAMRGTDGALVNTSSASVDFGGVALGPQILSIVALPGGTQIRVTFIEPIADNPAVTCIDSYAIEPQDPGDPAITIANIEAEGSPVESVLITTNEHHNLDDYDLTIHLIEVA